MITAFNYLMHCDSDRVLCSLKKVSGILQHCKLFLGGCKVAKYKLLCQNLDHEFTYCLSKREAFFLSINDRKL